MEIYGRAPELKKCPFCGSDATMLILPISDPYKPIKNMGEFWIVCDFCGTRMKKLYFKEGIEREVAQELADKWNKRVEVSDAA